jgi:three-Cys-motif partner protein
MHHSKLKEVSKVKHHILQRYFPPWAKILGSTHEELYYVDCFAGEGKYEGGELGSPLIIFRKARDVTRNKPYRIHLMFIEKNYERARQLKENLRHEKSNSKISYKVFSEDSRWFTKNLLNAIPYHTPVFFFIDPYGHPISIPEINRILQKPHAEIFLNLMWFRINMDLNNPDAIERLNQMFGHSDWSDQSFCQKSGKEREEEFLKYFCSQVHSKYHFHFRIRFDPEDRTPGGSKRTKYYLIHFCNHAKAVLLMKNVMWKFGDEEGTFDYSATSQGVLFSSTPNVDQLIKYLNVHYVGTNKNVEFTELQIETYKLPFIEKHYRDAIKIIESDNKSVSIARIKSKKTGIKEGDIICF